MTPSQGVLLIDVTCEMKFDAHNKFNAKLLLLGIVLRVLLDTSLSDERRVIILGIRGQMQLLAQAVLMLLI